MKSTWQERWLAGNTPWDLGTVTPALKDWVAIQDLTNLRVLVPGCGHGHDAAWLAQNGAQVTAVDIAAEALQRAKTRHGNQVHWLLGDIFDLQLPHCMDLVWEYTCFCAMEPDLRSEYTARIAQSLCPGGRYLGLVFSRVPDPQSGPPFAVEPSEWIQLLEPHFCDIAVEAPSDRSIEPRRGSEIWFEATKRHTT